jgi:hypothetical protein
MIYHRDIVARLGAILLVAGALVVILALPPSEFLRRYDLSKYWQWSLDWKGGDSYHVLYAINGRRLLAGGALAAISGAMLLLRALF